MSYIWNYGIYCIAVFRVCVCVCVCVSVCPWCLSGICEISGTGRRSAMLLSPTWRASAGELRRLLLQLTGCLVREEKPLEPFRSNHAFHVITVQYLRKWSSF